MPTTILEDILEDPSKDFPCCFSIEETSNAFALRYKWLGLHEFLDEYVDLEKNCKTKVVPGNGLGIYLNNKKFFDKIFGEVNDNALKFISYIIKEREQDTSMKRIATVFERAYENELNEENLPKKEALAQRENWLNKEILKLEESSFLESDEWSKKQKIIKSDWTRLSDEDKEFYDFAFAEIGFLLFEKFLKERQLKEELKLHFKTFAYGED